VVRRLADRMFAFWASRTTGETAAVFRIALGLLSMWAVLNVGINLERWFGPDGALPWSIVDPQSPARWSLVAIAPESDRWLQALVGAALLGAAAMTVGFYPRVGAFVVWAVMASFRVRNPHIQNGGDRLFLILVLLSMFAPLGHRWSVDAWLRARRALPPPALPGVWALRLVQLQIAWVYAVTGCMKLGNASWRRGTVMRDVLESPVYASFPISIDSDVIVALLTFGTLVFELGFPLAVWWRRVRLPVLAAGLALHAGIEIALAIPMFGAVMMTSYLAFLRDDEVRALVERIARHRRNARD
jgi:hypothetical protein